MTWCSTHENVSLSCFLWTLHMRHVYFFDAALSWVTVDTSLWSGSWLSGGSLFRVGTQLGEWRYKFLRRWAQYGSHSGAQGWEINQYETSWVRASAWSFSYVDLFFFTLLFSSHLHLLIGCRSWASVCLTGFAVTAIYCICTVKLVTVH